MKRTITTLFLLNINTAWAHTGHSTSAFTFALSVIAIALLAKPVMAQLLKIKKDN